ncbi:MAG TPA: hypothetical protein VMW87_11595 [Spirochaetia bacterium]|nr:hypothetical protein [Spirochaetia bacterium]
MNLWIYFYRRITCFAAVLPILVVAAVLLVSCVSARASDPHGFDRAPLFGMIYDIDNQPVAGVALQLDAKRGPESDLMGRFVLPALAAGEHKVIASKPGYETLSVDVHFTIQTQVLYLQLCSQAQLVQKAEESIAEREWGKAGELLDRAGRVDPANTLYRYTRAVLDFRRGRTEDAASVLRALLDAGVTEPAVYLFLADICQYTLGDSVEAAELLRAALERKGNPEVEKRLRAIEASEKSVGTASASESPGSGP